MYNLIKRLFLTTILAICSFVMLACGAEQSEQYTAHTAKVSISDAQAITNKKTLVVYFSHSGKTQTVANLIRRNLNADIVRIEPSEPYSQVYRETTQRARNELNNDTYPEIKNTDVKVSNYDVIFLGYPIWGGRAPRPVMTFLASQDFADKTVITFCTSGGSPISGSTPEIKAQIPNANIIEGIRTYPENETATLNWLNNLKL